MNPIYFIDRITGKKEKEQVYGEHALNFLYGDDLITRLFGAPLLYLLARFPVFSMLYGLWQKSSFSKGKILPFIKNFQIDTSEFLNSPDSFQSFNDFFVRKLKPEARPITPDSDRAIIPADGRYLFYQNVSEASQWMIKGKNLDLEGLLDSREAAQKYLNGSLVMARLCPTDYHRYHFPCDCFPGSSQIINGWLYSVNPMAVKHNFEVFTENKRSICELETEHFGKVLFIEIGATNVGSINQTYQPEVYQIKGAEKGYFSFGASALILLFEPGRLAIDQDLLEATRQNLEIKCLMGQSLGKFTP